MLADKTDLPATPGSGSSFDVTTSPGLFRDITWLPPELWTHPVPQDVIADWLVKCWCCQSDIHQFLARLKGGDLTITERLGALYPDPRQGVFPSPGESWPVDHRMVMTGQWRVPAPKRWDTKVREAYTLWAARSLPGWMALAIRYGDSVRSPRASTVKLLTAIFSSSTCRYVTDLAVIYRYRKAFDTTSKSTWFQLLKEDGGKVMKRIDILRKELGDEPPPRQLTRALSRKFFGSENSLPDPEDDMWKLRKILHKELCQRVTQQMET